MTSTHVQRGEPGSDGTIWAIDFDGTDLRQIPLPSELPLETGIDRGPSIGFMEILQLAP